jgi:DNA-directed RNA polymerase specialized sigma24 family protein
LYRVAFRLLHRRGLLPTTALDETVVPVTGPEDEAVIRVDLERALQAMPPRRRACAILCFALGLTPIDAAEALRIAPGTVRKQLELARSTLRSGLADQGGPLERPTTAAGS